MEKEIVIDLVNDEDLFEKYNKSNVSEELINYVIKNTISIDLAYKIKIVINNKTKNKDVITLIKEGLLKEYERCKREYVRNNIIQLVYLVIGILILIFSNIITEAVFKEIILIGGWLFIWTMAEMELFQDNSNRRRRKILKKLLVSEIVEK